MADDDRVARLEKRLDRERRAREEAESIAERGMRDLWLANRNLEARVEERTEDLARSLRAVTVAAEAKETFLSELGDDLATPLHAVLGLIELIDTSQLGPTDRDRLTQIHDHASALSTSLVGLVELAAASGETLPTDVEVDDPNRWLDELTTTWMPPAAGRGQLLLPSCDNRGVGQEVALDWKRLRKIVDAALSNVIAHADAGSVAIDLVAGPDSIEVAVRDSGPGMTEDQLVKITEPFVDRGAGGSIGVSMAVASRLAHSGGGNLEIMSVSGATKVTVSLPRHSAGPGEDAMRASTLRERGARRRGAR